MQPRLKPKVVLVRPQNNPSARVLSEWAETLLRDPSCEFVDLQGASASRRGLSESVVPSSAMVFFCHGEPEALMGGGEPILDSRNANLTNGRIVVAIACHSARTLGTIAITEGAVAFLGFDEQLGWCKDFSDEFGEAAVCGVLKVVNGATLGEAADAMREAYAKLVITFGKSNHENAAIAKILAYWNKGHVKLKGEASARLATIQWFSARARGQF